ncbi:MAG TPA: polyamine ABC transporter substrate-binding protein [Steroidobacteraceae bacterium]|jgi:putrescine transport system substrate-binding protein|nr:polyamine ABC transporter substrate-binding protein [Steroidobacteraceae bacterium]
MLCSGVNAVRLAALGLLAVCAVACTRAAPAAEEKPLDCSSGTMRSATRCRVYIYNWTDFIGPNTIAEFERLTGIKVVYDVYDAEETMEARLLAGGSGYDIVSASTDFFSREIKAGVYRVLDKSKLPNWKNLDPRVLAIQAAYDPGNEHAVPYLHSMNGFAYNVDMVHARMPNAPVDSLDMLFKPEVVSKFADCGVTFLDSAEDTIQLALKYLGLDPNSTRPEDFKAAENLLLKVRPYVRSFDSSEYLNGLANKEICVAMSWSSDYALSHARAKAVGINVDLAFTVPKEGANETFSSLLVPADAPHPEAAYRFLNFILRPDVIAEITNAIYYGNDNIASRPVVNRRILEDPTLYPTPQIEARLYRSAEVNAATERLRTRTWTRIKTAE